MFNWKGRPPAFEWVTKDAFIKCTNLTTIDLPLISQAPNSICKALKNCKLPEGIKKLKQDENLQNQNIH